MGKKITAANMMHTTSTVADKTWNGYQAWSDKNQERGYGFIHWIVNYMWYKQKHQLLLFMTLNQ
jgi:hypothetical protein